MTYDGKIFRRALETFEADREKRRNQLERRRQELYDRQPRLREIETQLRSAAPRVIAASMRKGVDPRPEVQKIRAENIRLQAERREILARLSLPPDYLEDVPVCPHCRDKGYLQDGQICPHCLRKYYEREQQRELSNVLPLAGQTFDDFSLKWYSDRYDAEIAGSPRKLMQKVVERCRKYAEGFDGKMENLLLYGNPGLGKTFLSAAIAQVVMRKGFSVVYDSAGNVFAQFENHHFRGGGDEPLSRIFACDLLIIDDLGSEMTTAFTQAALYQIINTRLTDRRSTIISTNLKPDQLATRYSPQIESRLRGEYQYNPFYGEDIRKQREREIRKQKKDQ